MRSDTHLPKLLDIGVSKGLFLLFLGDNDPNSIQLSEPLLW